MRNFGSLAFKQVRSRRARSLLTAAGIVLGVGMILGVLLLSATINRTFTDLYDSVYGKADLIVSGGGEDSLPKNALRKVEDAPGTGDVVGRIQSVFTLVDDEGEAPPEASTQLNVAGQDPDAPERDRLGDGRRHRSRARARDRGPGLVGGRERREGRRADLARHA